MADFSGEPVEPLYPTVDWEPGNGAPPHEHEEPPTYEPEDRWGPEEEQNSRDLTIRPIGVIDPTKIPPRQWVLGRYMLTGFLTVLVAAGGVGKTSWSLAATASIITGQPLLGSIVYLSGKGLYLNLEDPQEELERRLAAVTIEHNLSPEEVGAGLLVHTKDSHDTAPIAIVTENANGFHVSPIKDRLIALLKEHNIRVLVVDPFVGSHAVDENSNMAINAVAATWREIARETGSAVLLVHHVRKGGTTPGDADAARGAGALISASRGAFTLIPMSKDDADAMAVDEKDRGQFVRLDSAKRNMTPSAGDARWFRLASVNLGNSDPVFPYGDDVQVLKPHTFPGPFEGLSSAAIGEVLCEIERGVEVQGKPQLFSKASNAQDRWAGKPLMEMGDRTEEQAKAIIKAWLDTGLLYEIDTKDEKSRKRKGLQVDMSKAPGDVI